MKRLIIYASKYGCTESCAKRLAAMLPGEIDLIDLNSNDITDLSGYDQVILGGSIYAGQAPKRIREFSGRNLSMLLSKKVALFLCCFETGDNAQSYIKRTFPDSLVRQSMATEFFGWELHFNKMNRFERWIVKKIAKVDKDVSRIDEEAIQRLAMKCAG
ncbi:MAG TPA: flavodoxin domain-containing protein [Bacillota bacterium]|nr:flavodoxin domain-containing protein [Bacillota bacterium]